MPHSTLLLHFIIFQLFKEDRFRSISVRPHKKGKKDIEGADEKSLNLLDFTYNPRQSSSEEGTEFHRHLLGVDNDYDELSIFNANAAGEAWASSGSDSSFDADVLFSLMQQFMSIRPVLLTAYHLISFLMSEKWRS